VAVVLVCTQTGVVYLGGWDVGFSRTKTTGRHDRAARANACGTRRDMEVEEHYRYSVLYQQGQQQRQQFKLGYLPPWAQLSRHQRRVASGAGICNETDKYQNQIVALESY